MEWNHTPIYHFWTSHLMYVSCTHSIAWQTYLGCIGWCCPVGLAVYYAHTVVNLLSIGSQVPVGRECSTMPPVGRVCSVMSQVNSRLAECVPQCSWMIPLLVTMCFTISTVNSLFRYVLWSILRYQIVVCSAMFYLKEGHSIKDFPYCVKVWKREA